MAVKSLRIDSRELDLQNPRIPPAVDQRDAMQKIIAEQGKLINLAESIAVRGFSPMDRCIVVGSPVREGKFIVLEGNRRVLCAKLLKKPALIPTLDMPDALENAYCEPQKALIPKKWTRLIVLRPQRAPRAMIGSGDATTDDESELIVQKLPLSTLDQLLSTPSVRKAIGFEINKNKLVTELPPEEAIKPLKRLMLDLSDRKTINVTDLKKVTQQDAYIARMKATDRPDLTKENRKSNSCGEHHEYRF